MTEPAKADYLIIRSDNERRLYIDIKQLTDAEARQYPGGYLIILPVENVRLMSEKNWQAAIHIHREAMEPYNAPPSVGISITGVLA